RGLINGATGQQLTWGDVEALASIWVDHRRALLAEGGRCVGLLDVDPLKIAGWYLAGLSAGVGVAPLNPDATPSELAAQTPLLGLATILSASAEPPTAAALADAGCEVWSSVPGGLALRIARRRDPPPPPPGQAALLLASSGTTGAAKIVPITESQLLHSA